MALKKLSFRGRMGPNIRRSVRLQQAGFFLSLTAKAQTRTGSDQYTVGITNETLPRQGNILSYT